VGARAPPHKQASVLRPTPAIVRGAWVTANNTSIESIPTPPDPPLGKGQQCASLPGEGKRGGGRELEGRESPDGRESGGKRDERFKASFIARPGAPRILGIATPG